METFLQMQAVQQDLNRVTGQQYGVSTLCLTMERKIRCYDIVIGKIMSLPGFPTSV